MRIGAALPSNVLRLEYDYFIREAFGLGTLDFYRGGFVMLDKNEEHTLVGSKIRSLWVKEYNITESESGGIYLYRPGEDIPRVYTFSDLKEGWWKWRVKINGTILASRNEIHLFEADNNNYIALQIGVNNALKLVKREAAVFSDIIVPGFNLVDDTWYDIEITRDSGGNYEIWVDTVSKGTGQENFAPDSILTVFECYSTVGMYIKDIYIDHEKPS